MGGRLANAECEFENFFEITKSSQVRLVGKNGIIGGANREKTTMKKKVARTHYLNWLEQFRDRPLIKVLTGMVPPCLKLRH